MPVSSLSLTKINKTLMTERQVMIQAVDLLEQILGIIFPPKCIFCNNIMDIGTELNICKECYKKIVFIGGSQLGITGSDVSSGCDSAVSICRYTGIVKHSLIKYKFYNKPGYYRTFAKILAKQIIKVIDSVKFDMIISVPLHKSREMKRGYNQALLISKALSRETGIKDCSGLLERTINTNAQSLLDRKSRLLNVKGAFRVKNAEQVNGKNILLVDDILTTGTTVNECGRMLKQAGANIVIAAVIATGHAN